MSFGKRQPRIPTQTQISGASSRAETAVEVPGGNGPTSLVAKAVLWFLLGICVVAAAYQVLLGIGQVAESKLDAHLDNFGLTATNARVVKHYRGRRLATSGVRTQATG